MATGERYRDAIHKAVVESRGVDFYTGERLDWTLLGKFDNETAKRERRDYKKTLAMKPTVDHFADRSGTPDFRICAWQTNDAKSDLSHEEFVQLCQRVVAHHARSTGV